MTEPTKNPVEIARRMWADESLGRPLIKGMPVHLGATVSMAYLSARGVPDWVPSRRQVGEFAREVKATAAWGLYSLAGATQELFSRRR